MKAQAGPYESYNKLIYYQTGTFSLMHKFNGKEKTLK